MRPSGNPEILVVDAESAILDTLREAVAHDGQRSGATIASVHSAEESFEYAHAHKPELIFFSTRLPKALFWCARILKSPETAGLHVVIVFDGEETPAMERHRRLPVRASAYLQRPVSAGELGGVLGKLLRMPPPVPVHARPPRPAPIPPEQPPPKLLSPPSRSTQPRVPPEPAVPHPVADVVARPVTNAVADPALPLSHGDAAMHAEMVRLGQELGVALTEHATLGHKLDRIKAELQEMGKRTPAGGTNTIDMELAAATEEQGRAEQAEECATLRQECERRDAKITAQAETIDALKASLSESREAEEKLRAELEENSTARQAELSDLKTQLEEQADVLFQAQDIVVTQESRFDEITTERDALLSDRAALRGERRQASVALEQVTEELRVCKEKLDDLKSKLDAAIEEAAHREQLWGEVDEKYRSLLAELTEDRVRKTGEVKAMELDLAKAIAEIKS